MGISKDFSVVVDSEIASSPRSTASSPAPPKRAPRVYGRRREVLDTSLTCSEHDSNDSIYKTGPPGMSDEVPPSEPSGEYSDGEKSEDGDKDMLPTSLTKTWDNFGWKDKLKEIDQKEDLSEYLSTRDTSDLTSVQGVLPATGAVKGALTGSSYKASPFRRFKSKLSEDAPGSSLLSVASHSRSTGSQAYLRQSPFLKAPRNRSRTHKNIITSDDDMNDDDKHDSRPSSPQSSPLHPIVTPRSQTTSSPPTSQHDDLLVNSPSPSVYKGKGKMRRSVSPLGSNAHRVESLCNFRTAARSQGSRGQRQKKKTTTVKQPTKREIQVTKLERARLAAEQEVTIEKPVTTRKTIATLFQSIVNGQNQETYLRKAANLDEPSSPINQFPSSQVQSPGYIETTRLSTMKKGASSISRSSAARRRPNGTNSHSAEDSDSDALPHIGTVLGSSKGKSEPAAGSSNKEQEFRHIKFQLLQKQPVLTTNDDDDDDDDLEIIPPTKLEQQRKTTEKQRLSRGQRMVLSNAQVKVKRDSRKMTKEELDAYHTVILRHGTDDPLVLKTILKQQVDKESLKITREKQDQWQRLGGAVKGSETSELTQDAQKNLIQEGLELWTNLDGGQMMEEVGDEGEYVDEGEDPEWEPRSRASTSPTDERGDGEELNYEKIESDEVDENSEDQDVEEALSNANSTSDENDQMPVVKSKTRLRPRGRIVVSDESDSGEENDSNLTMPDPRDNRYAVSSSDDRTEDENDKENNTRLMFDRSEDKENKAVTRHTIQTTHTIFDDILDRDLTLSPPHVLVGDLKSEGADLSQSQSTASPKGKRKPLGVISDASPISLQRQPSTLTQAFMAQLKYSSPTHGPIEEGEGVDVLGTALSSTPAASLDFAPVFGDHGKVEKPAPLGFSQFSQNGLSSSASLVTPAVIQRGFSDLFDSGTQKDDAGTNAGGLQKQESLGLTQDLVLQPAFQVNEKLLRRADVIFEKEQEYVVEAAAKKGTKEPEYYVNEVGLLTQTKPSSSRLGTRSPSFILSPTQIRTQLNSPSKVGSFTQRLSTDPTQTRSPLRTISLSNPQILSSPETSPKLQRLHRRETPTPTSPIASIRSPISSNTVVASPSPSHPSINDVLGRGLPMKDRGLRKEKLRNDWVAEEAEESDEDQLAGFGYTNKWAKNKNDEEEEEGAPGEDLDAPLAELVDDHKMDEETEAVDRVLEKHQELLEKDDDEAFQFHQGVAQGDWRRKRKKGGFGIDDSDEEDEEDEKSRKLRKKMRQMNERGDIQELAKNEKTAAFASVYHRGLVDDDDFIELRPLDFDHELRTGRELSNDDEESQDVVMRDGQDLYDQAEDQDGARANSFSHKDLQAEVRKMKERPEGVNYEDVSWIDEQDGDEDDSVKIQVVNTTHKSKPVVPTSTSTVFGNKRAVEWDSSILGGARRRKENEKDIVRSREWARTEARNMTGSTGRLVGGIAVTSLGNKAKNGGGSLRSKGSQASVSTALGSGVDKMPLKTESSILARVTRNFGS